MHIWVIRHVETRLVNALALAMHFGADRGASSTDGSGAAHWQPYSAAEIDAAQASASGRTSHLPSGLSNTFTNFVTQTYARSSLMNYARTRSVCRKSSSPVQQFLDGFTCRCASVYHSEAGD